MTFNKQEAEHDLKELDLTHKFALRMASLASLICFSVFGVIICLGMFFGEKTPLTIGFVLGIATILGIISFKFTHSAALM